MSWASAQGGEEGDEHWSAATARSVNKRMSVTDLVDYVDNPGRRKSFAQLLQKRMSTATLAVNIHQHNRKDRDRMDEYEEKYEELTEFLEKEFLPQKEWLFESRTSLADWASAGLATIAQDKAKRKFLGLLRGERKGKGGKGGKGEATGHEPWWKKKQDEARKGGRRWREQLRPVTAQVDYKRMLAEQKELQRGVDASDGVYRQMLQKHEEIQAQLRRNLNLLLAGYLAPDSVAEIAQREEITSGRARPGAVA